LSTPGSYYDYRIVDDKTGEIIDSNHWYTDDAKEIARKFSQSERIISMDEYKRLYGKELDLGLKIDTDTGKVYRLD
jgi:hypothetical protein